MTKKKEDNPLLHQLKEMGPSDLHRAIGIRKKCVGCGRPAAIRIRVLVEYDELVKRQPNLVAGIAASNPDGPFVPTVPTKHGPMVKLTDVGACDLCRKTAEITAARDAPDWAIVEIDRRGLSSEHPIKAQVPGDVQ